MDRLRVALLILSLEKVLQHIVTAILLFTPYRPDPGSLASFLADPGIALANVVVAGLFALAAWGRWRERGRHRALLAAMAAFDVVAEWAFHGVGFVTVSLLVSVVILALLAWEGRSVPVPLP